MSTEDRSVEIDYTNWRGERRTRRIIPRLVPLEFTCNEWHPEPQWLLHAVDCEDLQIKTFALANIHAWKP